jgi:catechol 2,3-dioxygenase-like lactoylglutathione lyase family enzyme
MPITGIAHVQIAITPGGEDTARSFYGAILGMREISKPDSLSDRDGVWFVCGEQQLHCGIEEDVAISRRHPALLTDDLDVLRARLQEAGFDTDPDRQIPGYRRFYTHDPFGNRVELMQPDRPQVGAAASSNRDLSVGAAM